MLQEENEDFLKQLKKKNKTKHNKPLEEEEKMDEDSNEEDHAE